MISGRIPRSLLTVYTFRKFNYSRFIEILFWGWWFMLQLSTKNISWKSETARGKYARFSRLVPFFACKLPRLNGLLSWVWRAPPILHQLPINAGVKAQSILWCAWPPPGRSSTLKIACGSNIDDIRGNASPIHQKNFIKIGHRTWKIRSF